VFRCGIRRSWPPAGTTGCNVQTCEPFNPESKGRAEHTVKIVKADLVPTTDLAN
jgi:hypothetical protein